MAVTLQEVILMISAYQCLAIEERHDQESGHHEELQQQRRRLNGGRWKYKDQAFDKDPGNNNPRNDDHEKRIRFDSNKQETNEWKREERA